MLVLQKDDLRTRQNVNCVAIKDLCLGEENRKINVGGGGCGGLLDNRVATHLRDGLQLKR